MPRASTSRLLVLVVAAWISQTPPVRAQQGEEERERRVGVEPGAFLNAALKGEAYALIPRRPVRQFVPNRGGLVAESNPPVPVARPAGDDAGWDEVEDHFTPEPPDAAPAPANAKARAQALAQARARRAVPAIRRNLVLDRANFDRYVFGNMTTEALRRDWLDAKLDEMAERAVWRHLLTPADREKLLLAGRGDVKRFFDQVETRRAEFDRVRANLNAAIGLLNGTLQPLCREFQHGPFGDGSLYVKTLTKILADRQTPQLPGR